MSGQRWSVTLSVDLVGALVGAMVLGGLIALAGIGAVCLLGGGKQRGPWVRCLGRRAGGDRASRRESRGRR